MDGSGSVNVIDSKGRCLNHRVYRESIGRRPLGALLLLLVGGTIAILWGQGEIKFWPGTTFPCLLAVVFLLLFVLRQVTIDAQAQVALEEWRFAGKLTMRKRQRNLRDFAAVRSQRVEVVTKGDRRVYCDVYLVPKAGEGTRLEIERFEMGEEGGCPDGIAVGQDLARLTGLPFEDKC